MEPLTHGGESCFKDTVEGPKRIHCLAQRPSQRHLRRDRKPNQNSHKNKGINRLNDQILMHMQGGSQSLACNHLKLVHSQTKTDEPQVGLYRQDVVSHFLLTGGQQQYVISIQD